MRIIDPGHTFALKHLDGDGETIIDYVKREGPKYPGNVGHHEGPNIQDNVRAIIARLLSLDQQAPHWRNKAAIADARSLISNLEYRAAERHGRILRIGGIDNVEELPVCAGCGHIGCEETCAQTEAKE